MPMLSSMSKSSLSDVVNNKNTTASKAGRLGSFKREADSPPQKKPTFSNALSPRSADSKPGANRRSPKNSTTPDKQPRPLKGSELQLQLTEVQGDLIKVKEQLAFEEKEKNRVLEELRDAKKAVEEVSDKLAGALLAQKKAEENSEVDKFRADELEQLAMAAAQKREKEWIKELEDIQNQHALDVAALLSATEELRKTNQELIMATDAKNTALNHADDAMKVAEINAEKVDILSGEINRLQSLLDSKLENKSNETAKQMKKMGSDVEALEHELEKAKLSEEKLVEMEALVEGLKIQLIDARTAESDAIGLVDDWKAKAELLESYLEEVKQSERLVQIPVSSLTMQLHEAKSMLDDVESEVISLRGKVEALELEVARHKADHERSDSQLNLANQEVLDLEKTLELLKSELLRVEDEKAQALSYEKMTISNLEILAQEKSNLAIELDITKEDSEKAKKAMEGLASALHEVSAEARYIKERFLIKEAEVDNATADLEDLKLALKNTQDNYNVMLDEAKNEILCLKRVIDKFEIEAKDLTAERNENEINLNNTMRKTDVKMASISLERDKAVETFERKQSEVKAAMEEVNKLHDNLRQTESELFELNDSIEEAKAESRHLKERLLDRENELQSITQENDDLRVRDTTASKKIEELSESLAKLLSEKEGNDHTRGNAEHGENGKPYKTIELVEDEVDEPETGKSEKIIKAHEMLKVVMQLEGNDSEEFEDRGFVQMDHKICESETIDKLVSEEEHYSESIEDKLNTHVDRNNPEQVNLGSAHNGNISPTKRQEQQKKKKDLLHKFGSLIKRKNAPK